MSLDALTELHDRRCIKHEDCREDHAIGAACYAERPYTRGSRPPGTPSCNCSKCVGPSPETDLVVVLLRRIRLEPASVRDVPPHTRTRAQRRIARHSPAEIRYEEEIIETWSLLRLEEGRFEIYIPITDPAMHVHVEVDENELAMIGCRDYYPGSPLWQGIALRTRDLHHGMPAGHLLRVTFWPRIDPRSLLVVMNSRMEDVDPRCAEQRMNYMHLQEFAYDQGLSFW